MKPNDKALDKALSVTQIPEENMREYMRRVLTAAFVAQFQNEDYAGLVERLRLRAGIYKDTTDDRAAADALEALLVEREALRAELAKAQEIARVQAERIGGYIKTIEDRETERDALKADLASERDMTWFWEIVDAAGLNNVASFEQTALRELVKYAAERDALLARLAPLPVGDGITDDLAAIQQQGDAEGLVHIPARFITKNQQKVIQEFLRRYSSASDSGTFVVTFNSDKSITTERVESSTDPMTNEMTVTMPDDKLREIAAKHVAGIDGHSDDWDRYVDEAKDYIDAVRPHIEAAERDRCAKKILETNWVDANPEEIAAAIREGK